LGSRTREDPDPLVRRLLADGTVRPDPLRLASTSPAGRALRRRRRGEIAPRLYAAGPITKAGFWEMTSVPDIRRQCEALATHLAATLGAVQPRFA
jgi:uncharacterized NAD(P)/FAD-binding protein YdhS